MRWISALMPTSAAARCLAVTYDSEAASSPARMTAKRGTTPDARKDSTSLRSSARIVSATAFPSMMRALMPPSYAPPAGGQSAGIAERPW